MNDTPESLGFVILVILGFITISVVGQLIKILLRTPKKKIEASRHASS
ncbi:MAG: hypothetical protein KJ804_13980 [Proteobacteria bacterium]|nr:hypothetical protein [Pseudomonadota bacterium]MBU1059418.1 hypothetical protein [Pseudomonadota bacterium]